MKTKRYYLHGDAQELIPNQYYCKICDSFEEKEHFYSDNLHKESNYKNYNESLQKFKSANHHFLKYNSRPLHGVNLFSNIPEKMQGNFYRWLTKQKDRDDQIGDLSNDALSDKSFPIGTNSLELIKTYLIVKSACDEAIQALEEAYTEFKSKNKNRSGISLKLRFDVFKTDNYKCRICGASARDFGVKLEVDHKIPIAEGGTNEKSNLWTLCFNCNRGKGKTKL